MLNDRDSFQTKLTTSGFKERFSFEDAAVVVGGDRHFCRADGRSCRRSLISGRLVAAFDAGVDWDIVAVDSVDDEHE